MSEPKNKICEAVLDKKTNNLKTRAADSWGGGRMLRAGVERQHAALAVPVWTWIL